MHVILPTTLIDTSSIFYILTYLKLAATNDGTPLDAFAREIRRGGGGGSLLM